MDAPKSSVTNWESESLTGALRCTGLCIWGSSLTSCSLAWVDCAPSQGYKVMFHKWEGTNVTVLPGTNHHILHLTDWRMIPLAWPHCIMQGCNKSQLCLCQDYSFHLVPYPRAMTLKLLHLHVVKSAGHRRADMLSDTEASTNANTGSAQYETIPCWISVL